MSMTTTAGETKRVKIGDLLPMVGNFRRKRSPEKFADLVQSIHDRGVLTPLWVIPEAEGEDGHRLRVAAGEGRYLATLEVLQNAIDQEEWDLAREREMIPVTILSVQDAREARILTLCENLQREEMSLVDEVGAVAELLECGLDVQEMAAQLGISSAWVSRRAILSRAPERLMEALERRAVAVDVAFRICSLPDKDMREEVARRVLKPVAAVGVLDLEATNRLIESDYQLPLRDAPWDLKATGIFGDRPACTACPHMVDRKRAGMACGSPECFRAKAVTSWGVMVSGFDPDRYRVEPIEVGAAIFTGPEGAVEPDGEWIDLDGQVPFKDLGHWGAVNWGTFLAERLGASVESLLLVHLVLHPGTYRLRKLVQRAAARMLLKRAVVAVAAPAASAEVEEGDVNDDNDVTDDIDDGAAPEESAHRAAVTAETMPAEALEVYGGLFRAVVTAEEANDPALERPGFVRRVLGALLHRMRPVEVRQWAEVCGVPIDGDPVRTACHHVGGTHPKLLAGLLAVACVIGRPEDASRAAGELEGGRE